mmetsp:Transcript_41776/g.75009  ORF Transcript_41776/g.75009 Transcript_41776/m.75009 type:complete len:304 (+) Transcript_41776:1527-2438(+)
MRCNLIVVGKIDLFGSFHDCKWLGNQAYDFHLRPSWNRHGVLLPQLLFEVSLFCDNLFLGQNNLELLEDLLRFFSRDVHDDIFRNLNDLLPDGFNYDFFDDCLRDKLWHLHNLLLLNDHVHVFVDIFDLLCLHNLLLRDVRPLRGTDDFARVFANHGKVGLLKRHLRVVELWSFRHDGDRLLRGGWILDQPLLSDVDNLRHIVDFKHLFNELDGAIAYLHHWNFSDHLLVFWNLDNLLLDLDLRLFNPSLHSLLHSFVDDSILSHFHWHLDLPDFHLGYFYLYLLVGWGTIEGRSNGSIRTGR